MENNNWLDYLNDSDKELVNKFSPQELATLVHESLLKKININPVKKGQLIGYPKRYDFEDCSSTPYSTDFKVNKYGRYVYVELKNYVGSVPIAELKKFQRDVSTKGNIFAALFVGWNENKFYYYRGVPILLMKSHDLIDEGLDILYAIEPRKNIDKLIESMDDVINMIHLLDKMSTDFNKNKDEIRGALLVFIERCKNISVTYPNAKEEVDKMSCHLVNNKNLYDFVFSLSPQATLTKKVLSIGNINFKLLKTKTIVMIIQIITPGQTSTITFDLSEDKLDYIIKNLVL